MGRRATNPHVDDAGFKALDERFRLNECNDAMVEALNMLPADDRALIIMWLLLRRNKTALAKALGLSVPFVRDRLWRVQELMKEYYKQITKQREEDDESFF
jgi:DNA-directed RNA polymerase specialized sigma24 family protein